MTRLALHRLAMCLVAALSGVPSALAQESERVQQASRLFDSAREHVARGELEQACRELDESERLDPQLGTKLHLADCYERQGKLASAWLIFRAAEMLAAERIARGAVEPRRKVARLRAARLQARLPTIALVFAAPVPGMVVTLDGRMITARTWSTTIPVDPGEHELRISAPGRSIWRQAFAISERKHRELQVPELPPASKPSGPPPIAATLPPKAAARVAPTPEPSPKPLIAYTLTGVGLVALGTGIAFGVATRSTLSERGALCPDNVCRDRDEFERVGQLTTDARSTATPATVLMIGGGVALAAGLTWLVLGPKSSDGELSLALNVLPNAAGVTLQGRGF